MSIVLAALAIALPGAPAHHQPVRPRRTCRTHRCLVRVARKRCERGSVVGCIQRGARAYRVDEEYLIDVAWCESSHDPGAVNGRYVGLFQFGPDAWRRTPYASRSRTSAKWSSLAAGYAFSRGRAREWSCA